jgi:hypothetical protein
MRSVIQSQNCEIKIVIENFEKVALWRREQTVRGKGKCLKWENISQLAKPLRK